MVRTSVDADFKSKKYAACPPEMCRMLALAIILAWLRRLPFGRGGSAQPDMENKEEIENIKPENLQPDMKHKEELEDLAPEKEVVGQEEPPTSEEDERRRHSPTEGA